MYFQQKDNQQNLFCRIDIQQNTFQQNTFQQKDNQQNTFKQNTFQQNTSQQKDNQQNTFKQNNFQQIFFKQNGHSVECVSVEMFSVDLNLIESTFNRILNKQNFFLQNLNQQIVKQIEIFLVECFTIEYHINRNIFCRFFFSIFYFSRIYLNRILVNRDLVSRIDISVEKEQNSSKKKQDASFWGLSHKTDTRQRQGHKRDKKDRDRDLTGIKKGIIFPVGDYSVCPKSKSFTLVCSYALVKQAQDRDSKVFWKVWKILYS